MEREKLKEMFANGKRPTGEDFAQLIDALWANIESQLANTMRVVRIQYVSSSAPVGFKPGEYWWNPAALSLTYMGDSKSEEVDLRTDRLYVVEEDGDYLPGVYVAYAGELRYLEGVSL